MSFLTIALYIAAFGLWMACIHREGGIGGGVRFMFAFSIINQFLVAPPLYVFSGLGESEIELQSREEAVQLALYSMIGFVIGAYLIVPQLMRRPPLRVDLECKRLMKPDRMKSQWQVAVALTVAGATTLLTLGPISAIPTMRAIVSQLTLLLDTGLTLMAFYLMLGGSRDRLYILLTCIVASAAFRAIATGFFGNTAMTALYLLAILIMGRRCSMKSWLYLVLCLYLLLIPYGIWMGVRGSIREGIRVGASMEERIFAIDFARGRGTSLFNPLDSDDLRLIQLRIDQSNLLAAAMQHTPAREPHAWGYAMVQDVLVALIPRAMWPDKPLTAGGYAFVAQYTGIKFSPGVSVGVNYIFEFYVNFGQAGAVICIAIMGIVCGILDYLFFSFGYRSFVAQWTILMCMWSICVWSDRMAQLAMSAPVALFNSWAFGRFLQSTGWAPTHYDPPGSRPPSGSRRMPVEVPDQTADSKTS